MSARHPPAQFLKCIEQDQAGGNTLTDEDAIDATNEFIKHVKWLEVRHIKRKSHSDEYLIGNVFGKAGPFFATPEANAYCRSHLRVSIRQLEKLLIRIAPPTQSISLAAMTQHKEILRDYVFDLIEIANFLERKKNADYAFLQGGKSAAVHSWELYVLGRRLAIQSSYRDDGVHFGHKTAQIASIFVLRQALELRFERLISVYPIRSTGESPRLRHGFHFDFIVAQPHHFTFRDFNFEHLRKVYDWCSEIVHAAYQPYVWQTDWAFELCEPLLGSHSVPRGEGWSIHNGVKVIDLSKMQSAFCGFFLDNYDHHDDWCFYARKPEADVPRDPNGSGSN